MFVVNDRLHRIKCKLDDDLPITNLEWLYIVCHITKSNFKRRFNLSWWGDIILHLSKVGIYNPGVLKSHGVSETTAVQNMKFYSPILQEDSKGSTEPTVNNLNTAMLPLNTANYLALRASVNPINADKSHIDFDAD